MAGGYNRKYYGGGYEVAKLNANVRLPAEMKCARCKKFKGPSNYSNRQQQIYKDAMIRAGERFIANTVAVGVCFGCSPQEKTELKCDHCETWMDRTKFSKVQRVKDDPLCIKCSTRKSEKEPGEEFESEEEQEEEHSGDSRGESDDDGDYATSYGGTFSGGSRSFANGTSTSGGGVALPSASTAGTAATGSRPSDPSAGYLPPHLRGNASAQSSSPKSTVESLTRSMAQSTVSSSAAASRAPSSLVRPTTNVRGPSSAFAKVKAYKPKVAKEDSSSEKEYNDSDEDDSGSPLSLDGSDNGQ